MIYLRCLGLEGAGVSRLCARVGAMPVGPRSTSVLIWPVHDLAGDLAGAIVDVIDADGRRVDQIDCYAHNGLVDIASGDGEPVVAGDMATGLAAAVGSSRSVAVHLRGRLVLPAAMRSVTLALARTANDGRRHLMSAAVWRQRRRLDRIKVVDDLIEHLAAGGPSAVAEALASARIVYVRRSQRVASLQPTPAPSTEPEANVVAASQATRVSWEIGQLLAGVVTNHNAGATRGRVVIKAPAGVGKTDAMLDAVAGVEGVATIGVPDYAMARELLARALDKGLDATVIYAKLVTLDPAADYDDPDAERYCSRARVVMGLRKSGMDIGEGPVTCSVKTKDDDGQSIILNCPSFDDCLYRNQRIAKINIVTHESLFHDPHPGLAAAISRTPPFLVVDEKLNYIDHCDIKVADINSHKYIDSWVSRLLVGDGMLDRRRVDDVIAYCRDNGDLDGIRDRLKDKTFQCDQALFVALIREQAQSLRVSTYGRPTPDRPDSEILAWARKGATWKLPRVAALLGAVAAWIETGTTQRFAALHSDGVIKWDHARPLAGAWASATIVGLDASDRPELRHPALRGAETHVLRAPRRARVIQLCDRELGKTGFFAAARGDGDRRVAEINDFLRWLAEAQGAGGLIAQKDVLSRLQVPTGWEALNYGGLRGKDCLKRFDVGVVIGRMRPTAEAVDRIVRAIDPDAGRPGEDFVAATLGLAAKDGARADVQVVRGCTDLHNEVLASIREDEILQAVDRFRLIHRVEPATIYLLTSVPLAELQPDQLMTWRADVIDKDPVTAYLRASVPSNGRRPVAIPLEPAHMASIQRETGAGYFAGVGAAKQALKRWSKSSAAIKDFWRPAAAAKKSEETLRQDNRCQIPIRLSRVYDTFRREVLLSVTFRRVTDGKKSVGRPSRALLAYSPPEADDIDAAINKMTKQADGLLREALGAEVTDVKVHRVGVSASYVEPEVDVLYGEGVARPDLRGGAPAQQAAASIGGAPAAGAAPERLPSWDGDDVVSSQVFEGDRAPTDLVDSGAVDAGSPAEDTQPPPNAPVTYDSFRAAFGGVGPASIDRQPAIPAPAERRERPFEAAASAAPEPYYPQLPIDGVYRYRADTGMIYLPVSALPPDHGYGWCGGYVPGTELCVYYDDEDDLDLWTPEGKAAWELRWDDAILLAAYRDAVGHH